MTCPISLNHPKLDVLGRGVRGEPGEPPLRLRLLHPLGQHLSVSLGRVGKANGKSLPLPRGTCLMHPVLSFGGEQYFLVFLIKEKRKLPLILRWGNTGKTEQRGLCGLILGSPVSPRLENKHPAVNAGASGCEAVSGCSERRGQR